MLRSDGTWVQHKKKIEEEKDCKVEKTRNIRICGGTRRGTKKRILHKIQEVWRSWHRIVLSIVMEHV
jgi:hypothetical protein